MTVLEVIQRSAAFLATKGVDSPRLQAELLLSHVLQMPRLNLYLQFERQLTEPELNALRDLVKRRGQREPLQHLLGTASFCGLELRVTPDVLVPRPETELLAEKAWTFLQQRLRDKPETSVSALDFGTGSGAIAIALAVKAPQARVYALDASSAALAVARENAARYEPARAIEFIESTGFERAPEELQFDLIVSNPPYIPSGEIAGLMPEVRDYDPRQALDGGADGLVFYRYLAEEAGRFLRPAGRLMLEFGDGQETSIRAIFEGRHWTVESVEPDLSGRPRILIAKPSDS